MDTERWLWVPEYEDRYLVSNMGRVQSVPRPGARGGMLGPTPDSDGYLLVSLSKFGIRWVAKVHALVLTAFDGPRPDGMEARHLNGDRADNRWPENLAWGTAAENTGDKMRHGTIPRGSQIQGAKLTEAQVAEIRRAYAAGGITHLVLAAAYGVDRALIGQIIRREIWRHVA